MTKPLVSILVPTFNRSDLLRRALGSALAQTYSNFEVLVSDNNSTDETRRVIADFVERDPRVRQIASPPPQTPAMLNIRNVVAAAQGRYALVLADDDFLLDYRYVENGVKILQSHDAGLLITDAVLGGTRREATFLAIPPIVPGREFFLKFWRWPYHIPALSNLFDLELARRCDPWNDPAILYADVELWLKMMTLTDVAYYPYPAVYYDFHGSNIVSTVSLAMHKQNARFIDNTARFATAAFGEECVLSWKKNILIEYLRIVLEERHPLNLDDVAEIRAAAGLRDERLAWEHWKLLGRYYIRQRRRSTKAAFRSWRRRGRLSATSVKQSLIPS